MGFKIEAQALEKRNRSAHNIGPILGEGTRLKHLCWIACSLALFAAPRLAAAAGDSGRTVYKWVDDKGMTHYGDRIPPEYAAKEQHVINAQGVEVNRLEAQKSAEQVAAEEQKKADVLQSKERDRNLLNTYASVQEIERLRDQRVALLSDQIKVTSQFLEALNGQMKKVRAGSLLYKPYSSDPNASRMPDQVAQDLVHVSNDIHTQEENLREKRGEESTMGKQFELDIARFKELKGIH